MSEPTRLMRPTTFSDRSLAGITLGLFGFGMACSVLGAPTWLENTLRSLVLFWSFGIMAIALVIVRVYYHNFRAAPQHARLLPRHVVQLGALVIGLLFSISAITIDKVATTLVWYGIPFLLPLTFIGFIGLLDMVRWLPDRRNKPNPSGQEPPHTRRSTD